MNKSKWPDFLFVIAVRFVCGTFFGGLACVLFLWKGILRAFSHDATFAPLIWLSLCGFAGGVVAVFTVPRWKTPWYKRDSEQFSQLLADEETHRQGCYAPGVNVVKRSVAVQTIDEHGERHQYSSMEEVPPEIRSEIENLEKEALQEKGKELSVTETSQAGNVIASKILKQKTVSVYKIVDESGTERTYHSLDEMPPEIRAAIVEAEHKL